MLWGIVGKYARLEKLEVVVDRYEGQRGAGGEDDDFEGGHGGPVYGISGQRPKIVRLKSDKLFYSLLQLTSISLLPAQNVFDFRLCAALPDRCLR